VLRPEEPLVQPSRSLVLIVVILSCLGCADDKPTEHPYRIEHSYGIGSGEFERTIGNLLGPPLRGGNAVTTLVNGEQIFPPMLEAIRGAKRTIDFETYVYWRGEIGQKFTDALSERASNGVQVHVMVDPVGSDKIDKKYLQQMRDAGVKVVEFHHLKLYDWTSAQKLNNRTHRKLLIVDGEVGFTGGVGIADEWAGNADSPKHYRDNHYELRGPVVAQLQAAFADNWMGSTGQVIHGDAYFPELHEQGKLRAQVFASGPQGGSESMELLYLLSIAAAEKNIRLGTAYFVPDDLTIHALIDAKQRGVSVQIIVPGKYIDEKIVRPASRARWGELLKAGVEIYEYQPTMYHSKQMIIDDQWVSIGSANLDNRSFRLNAEANLNVMDRDFAQGQIQVFDDDLAHCKQITYEQWEHRPGQEKFMESFVSVFGWLM
jgi:cardiolipin synthase